MIKADGVSETRAFAQKAQTAVRDWLREGNIDNDAPAVEDHRRFLRRHRTRSQRRPHPRRQPHGAARTPEKRGRRRCRTRATQKFAAADPRLEKLSAETDALRKLNAELKPKLAQLTERVEALERTQRRRRSCPGFGRVQVVGTRPR